MTVGCYGCTNKTEVRISRNVSAHIQLTRQGWKKFVRPYGEIWLCPACVTKTAKAKPVSKYKK